MKFPLVSFCFSSHIKCCSNSITPVIQIQDKHWLLELSPLCSHSFSFLYHISVMCKYFGCTGRLSHNVNYVVLVYHWCYTFCSHFRSQRGVVILPVLMRSLIFTDLLYIDFGFLFWAEWLLISIKNRGIKRIWGHLVVWTNQRRTDELWKTGIGQHWNQWCEA